MSESVSWPDKWARAVESKRFDPKSKRIVVEIVSDEEWAGMVKDLV